VRKRARPRLARPEPLAAILNRAGENRFSRQREVIPSLLWRDAVGARIAERAHPLSLEDDVLWLRVPSSVWANELSLLSDEVRARLKERGVVVRELRFRVGAVPVVERPPERRVARTVPAARDLPPDLAQVLARVDDADLRAVLAGAAAANLAWQTVARKADPLPLNEAQRAARAPRSAAGETARPAPESPASPAAPPGKHGGGRDRSR
jgi:predicted nucleic acid-binding Zn ribbon protein